MKIHRWKRSVLQWSMLVAIVVAACGSAPPARGEPQVSFDVGYAVACREVTSEEFLAAHPDKKLIEARFEISALVHRGSEQELAEIMYVIWSPEERLNVVDFEPKTQLTTDVEDKIQVIETDERTSGIEAGVKAKSDAWPLAHVEPTAGASASKSDQLQQRYSKLPPKHLVVAAGTLNRRHGVAFKLRPSSQHSLQGQKELVCLFAVPKQWRADYVAVACMARARPAAPWTASAECGSKKTMVGLYLAGDEEARQAALEAVRAYEAYENTKKKGLVVWTSLKPPGGRSSLLRRLSAPLLGPLFSEADEEKSPPDGKEDARTRLHQALDRLAELHGATTAE